MSRRLILFVVAVALVGVAPVANATLFSYYAHLNGPSEFPVNASPGVGYAQVTYDDVDHSLFVSASFSGLLGGVTAAHIHAATPAPFSGTAAVATTTPSFTGFPSGVTSGNYFNVLDLEDASSFRAGFITANGGIAGAESALATAMANGTSYFNIHTNLFPGGEIRGFLQPVPEPASMISLLVGLASIAGRGVRRRGSKLPA